MKKYVIKYYQKGRKAKAPKAPIPAQNFQSPLGRENFESP